MTLHVFVRSPWAPLGHYGFSDFSCLRLPQQFWEVLAKYFAACPWVWLCLMFFSWLSWAFGLPRRKATEVNGSFHYIALRIHTIDMTYHLAEVVFGRFLHYRLHFFFLSINLLFRIESQAKLQGRGHLLEGQVAIQLVWHCYIRDVGLVSLVDLFSSPALYLC